MKNGVIIGLFVCVHMVMAGPSAAIVVSASSAAVSASNAAVLASGSAARRVTIGRRAKPVDKNPAENGNGWHGSKPIVGVKPIAETPEPATPLGIASGLLLIAAIANIRARARKAAGLVPDRQDGEI